jgi:hypothetical protein
MVLSKEPEARVNPSEEKATDLTKLEWPVSVCSSLPVLTSQSLMVSSLEPEARVDPSEQKATDSTKFKWPVSVCRLGLHVASTCGNGLIHCGISLLYTFRTILCSGENTSPE